MLNDIISAQTTKNVTRALLKDVAGVFLCDPQSMIDLLPDLIKAPSTIRDGIFMDSLQAFLLHTYQYDYEKRLLNAGT